MKSLLASNLAVVFFSGIFCSFANGAVTFYDDKDAFLSALGDATTRTTVACTPYEMDNKFLPFTQGDLTFNPTAGESPFLLIYRTDPNFNQIPVYQIATKGIENNAGKTIDVAQEYPFFAIGFDMANAQRQDWFGIKVFDDVVREYYANDANAGQGSKFYGWISDSGSVSQFQIGGGPSSTTPQKEFNFRITNFIYAVPEGSEATDLGHDCDNYNPVFAPRVCSASAWGDPHIITWDGLRFDAHPKGEAIFLKSTTSALQVQGRLEKAGPFQGNPAVTTGIAIRGDTPVQPDLQVTMATVEGAPNTVSARAPFGQQCPVELYVNGSQSSVISHGVGSGGAQVQVTGSTITIEYPSLLRVEMTVFFFGRCYFGVDVHLLDCESQKDSVIGLLGSPNGNHQDDWMSRDGTILPIPSGAQQAFFQPAFDYTKQNWILDNETESLFYYEASKSFFDFADSAEVYDPAIEELVGNASPEVALLCGGDIGCLIDGETLGTAAAQEYLDNPATQRTPEGPTASPTGAPVQDDIEDCRHRERYLETLEEKWNIGDPTFAFSRLNFTLDFGISDSISDQQQIRATLYENTCTTPYTGVGLTKNPNIGLYDGGLPSDGL